jgi:hypothetical protein
VVIQWYVSLEPEWQPAQMIARHMLNAVVALKQELFPELLHGVAH